MELCQGLIVLLHPYKDSQEKCGHCKGSSVEGTVSADLALLHLILFLIRMFQLPLGSLAALRTLCLVRAARGPEL